MRNSKEVIQIVEAELGKVREELIDAGHRKLELSQDVVALNTELNKRQRELVAKVGHCYQRIFVSFSTNTEHWSYIHTHLNDDVLVRCTRILFALSVLSNIFIKYKRPKIKSMDNNFPCAIQITGTLLYTVNLEMFAVEITELMF